jgi:hypothetical protein
MATPNPEEATQNVRRAEENVLDAFGAQEVLLELVPLYFQYVHNIAHTIFHEPSFLHRLQEGKASMTHVYAMCALAARLVSFILFWANSSNDVLAGIPRIGYSTTLPDALVGRYMRQKQSADATNTWSPGA